MELKDVFGEIEADGAHLVHGRLLEWALTPPLWHAEAVGGRPHHQPPCCSGPLHRIGEDVSERLDIVPARAGVLGTPRPKSPCRACEDGVVQAPAPARLIEGGLPT